MVLFTDNVSDGQAQASVPAIPCIFAHKRRYPVNVPISATIKQIPLEFQTAPTLFSPGAIDIGTLAMLSAVDFSEHDKVLDLGCGYGVVGILAARLIGESNVIMCDIAPLAVQCAQYNARHNRVPGLDIRISDGFSQIPENDFTIILSNPPYHTDFKVAKHFIETGFHKLTPGGRLVMVTKRLTWYKNKLTSIFGGVSVHEKDGYFVFVAEKRMRSKKSPRKTQQLSRKLARKYQK